MAVTYWFSFAAIDPVQGGWMALRRDLLVKCMSRPMPESRLLSVEGLGLEAQSHHARSAPNPR